MNATSNKSSIIYITGIIISLTFFAASVPYLAGNLGISIYSARKVIDIIDAYSTIVTIISLVGVIVGYGVISTAIVVTAKVLSAKFGKKYAAVW